MKDIKIIRLTNRGFAIVSLCDYKALSIFKWREFASGRCKYACRSIWENGKVKTFFMHRIIMGCEDGSYVDHINHDGLDNRRSNLRKCTKRQNSGNGRCRIGKKYSNYRGVSFHKNKKIWIARCRENGKMITIGRYKTEYEAALAFDEKAGSLYGEFACLNIKEKL